MLRTIQLYEQLSLFEASADFKGELVALRDYLTKAKTELDSQVNNLVANLHAQLTSEKLPNKTGFFRGIHQWWKNLWGRDSKDNPYYWQNRIGALGRTDIDPPSVEEYRMINDLAVSLTEALEASPQPLVTKILNQWSGRLRATIGRYMDNMIARVNKIAGTEAAPVEPDGETPPPSKPPVKEKPVDHAMSEEERDKEAARAAWKSIKDIADESEREEFKKFADRKLWKDAVHYAQTLLASKGKKPLDPATPADAVPPKVDKPRTIDDEAAELGITPDTKTNLGVFKSLSEKLKRFVIDACKSSAPECPVGKTTPEEETLAHYTSLEIHRILRKYEGKSVENVKSGRETIDDEAEKKVILAVHEPWLSLGPKERQRWNNEGSGDVPLKSHNRVIGGLTFPFRIPPLLREDDPRFHILRDYYPEHFKKLGRLGRLEAPEDKLTPGLIDKKIKRNIRNGKVSGEFEAERDPEPAAEARPEPKPRERGKGRMGGEKEERRGGPRRVKDSAPMEELPHDAVPESVKDIVGDFPSDIAGPILKLAEDDEDRARAVAAVWQKIKDEKRSVKKSFKALLDKKEWDHAISFGKEDDDDDEMEDMLSHYQPKGPTLLEALKTRLRLQREGKATAWEPMPKKMTPQGLVERLRQQSSKLYQES